MSDSRTALRSVSVVGVFTGLSAIGGLIKFGSPVGSIAFDSSPGFFVAAYYSPILGGAVGALGHIASSATAGFPLSWLHVPIALLQAVWSWIFGVLARRFDNKFALIPIGILVTALNGVLAPLILTVIDPGLKEMLTGLIYLLIAASAANVLLAAIALVVLAKQRTSAT